jgi:ABC-type bacteriocin/lantibiotic exporter with double-glycine peptidase domain
LSARERYASFSEFNRTKRRIIYVMDNGSIVEKGTHDELMQGNTVYKSLVCAEKTLEVGA